MLIGEFDSVDAAWRAIVRSVSQNGIDVVGSVDPMSVGSTFGKKPRDFREMLGASVTILNPRNRLTRSQVRPVRLDFLLANVIWTGVGSDKLSQIAFYNSRGRDFSDNNRTLAAAPGKRIFQSANGNQFQACAELLLHDPSTRRAVISIFGPEDVGSGHRDCSCVLTIQFLLRNLHLHCIVSIRSQSALMVFPYDAFLLTMIHESMAAEIGAKLGTLHCQYGSLHFYHDETFDALQLLEEHPSPIISMPVMKTSIQTAAGALASAEQLIRSGCRISDRSELDDYWLTYIQSLAHAVRRRRVKAKTPPIPDLLLNSWYDALLD